jgi:hypothetical protein
MLLEEIFAVNCEEHADNIRTLLEQNVGHLIVRVSGTQSNHDKGLVLHIKIIYIVMDSKTVVIKIYVHYTGYPRREGQYSGRSQYRSF